MDAGAFGRAITVLDNVGFGSGSAARVLRETLDVLATEGDDLARVEAHLASSRGVLADAIDAGVGVGSSDLADARRSAGNVIAVLNGSMTKPTHEALLLGTKPSTFDAAGALRFLGGEHAMRYAI